MRRQVFGVDDNGVIIQRDVRAQRAQHFAHRLDIGNMRHVVQNALAARSQQSRGKNGETGVFRTGNRHFADKRNAAHNNDAIFGDMVLVVRCVHVFSCVGDEVRAVLVWIHNNCKN